MPYTQKQMNADSASQTRSADAFLENLHNAQEGGRKRQADRDMLAQKNQYEQQEAAANQDKLKQFLSGQMGKGSAARSYNPSTGAIGAEKDDDLRALLGMERLNAQKEERQRRGVETMGKRVDSAHVPNLMAAIGEAEAVLPPEGQEMQSIGPVANWVPDVAVPFAEKAGFMGPGATAERRALAGAEMQVAHPLVGSARTPSEMAGYRAAYGRGLGTDTDTIRKAVQSMKEIPQSTLRNIESSTDPAAVEQYRAQGGLTSSPKPMFSGNSRGPLRQPAASATESEEQEYARLKAKHNPGR